MKRKRRLNMLTVTISVIIILTCYYTFTFSQVIGQSMSPTIKHEQWIVSNRISYWFNQPKRGDIVVIKHKDQKYVKRIIGLPNETVEIIDQQLYIDDVPYTQRFITNKSSFWTHDIPKTKVPSHSYYVLGDNRIMSNDSRYELGFINKADIIGRAEFIIYPLSDWKVIH